MSLYYIFRDRIPFFLSVVWLYRWRLSRRDFLGIPLTELLGYYMITLTSMILLIVTGLFVSGQSLILLVGFKWSFPSPFTWGALILAGTYNLCQKHEGRLFTVFEAFYLSFMTSIAGGFLYEILRGIPYWIISGYAQWNWANFNTTKILFFDFQVFTFPIVIYLLQRKFSYRMSKEMVILIGSVVVFYLLGLRIAPFYHRLGSLAGNTFYSWIMRLPMALLLYCMLDEVRKYE